MKTLLAFALFCSTQMVHGAASEDAVSGANNIKLGAYSNVSISPMSGDCGGISVQLWYRKSLDRENIIFGNVFDASGSCPGTKLDIREVSYQKNTGKIAFVANDNDNGKLAAEFSGTLTPTHLTGKFGFANQNTGKVTDWFDVSLKHLSSRDWKLVGTP